MLDNIWATYNLVVFENTLHMDHIWAAYGPHMGCPYAAHLWPICFGRSTIDYSSGNDQWLAIGKGQKHCTCHNKDFLFLNRTPCHVYTYVLMHVIDLEHDCLLTGFFFQFLPLLPTLFVRSTFVSAYVMVDDSFVVRVMVLNWGIIFYSKSKMASWSKPTHFKGKQSFSLENSSSLC